MKKRDLPTMFEPKCAVPKDKGSIVEPQDDRNMVREPSAPIEPVPGSILKTVYSTNP